MFQKPNILENT
jgi:hypothetical protein